MTTGNLFLIPCPISEDGMESISLKTREVVLKTQFFVVERLRTARRFLKQVEKSIDIDALHFYELEKHDVDTGLSDFLYHLKIGHNIGLISEAGNPAIADPGNSAVAWCHRNGIKVVPLAGPSAILMALIASGFNGQNFAFNGYLPNNKGELVKKLRFLESLVEKTKQSQLFMETPYRNGNMIEACIEALNPQTMLMMACDLDAPTEQIIVQSVAQWKNIDLEQFHKRPAVFGIG